MLKGKKGLIIKLLISGLLIYFLFHTLDLQGVLEAFKKFNVIYIPFIVLLLILNYVISSIRWKSLLIYENTSHVSVWYLIKLYFVGAFFNNFMPTSIGGDAYKVYRLGKKIDSISNAFSATFMERFTGVLALCFIAIFGLVGVVIFGTDGVVVSQDTLVLALSVVVLLVFLSVSIYVGLKIMNLLRHRTDKFNRFYEALVLYRGKTRVLTSAFITSFIVQFLSIFTQYFIFVGLGSNLEVFKTLFIFPVITLASFFIPSLNGIGVQDFLYNYSNGFLGVSASIAISSSFLYHIFRLAVSLIGGVIYAFDKEN